MLGGRSGTAAALATAALAVLALAPVALALPGDPGFTATTPADGATLPVDADGIPVAFTCPLYRISDAGGGFVQYGGGDDYGVSFARAATLGPDGRLVDAVALGTGRVVPGTQDQCTSAMAAGGATRPQETPGTYFWQVWRVCVGCPTGYEAGPVRRLVLRSTARPRLTVPARVYAGFPVIATVTAAGLPDGTPVTVQRRRGGAWVRVGSGTVLSGRAEPTVTLPRGAQRLRVTAVSGSETVVSAEVARAVRGSGGRTTRVTAGRYRGVAGNGAGSVRFRVEGRTIRGFTATVTMLCPGVTAGQLTTQAGVAPVARIRLAPDGSFVGATTAGRETSIRVRGRLAGSRLTGGRVELSVGSCTGSGTFRARRG